METSYKFESVEALNSAATDVVGEVEELTGEIQTILESWTIFNSTQHQSSSVIPLDLLCNHQIGTILTPPCEVEMYRICFLEEEECKWNEEQWMNEEQLYSEQTTGNKSRVTPSAPIEDDSEIFSKHNFPTVAETAINSVQSKEGQSSPFKETIETSVLPIEDRQKVSETTQNIGKPLKHRSIYLPSSAQGKSPVLSRISELRKRFEDSNE